MVFTALFLVVTRYKVYEWKNIYYSMIPHLAFSCLIIPLDYIFEWDYMQYFDAGGIPLIEDLTDFFSNINLKFLTTITMILIYLLFAIIFVALYKGYDLIVKKFGIKNREKI